MDSTSGPGINSVSLGEMERKADELNDAVDIYERFVDEELYDQEELPSEVEGYMRELDEEALEEGISPGIVLANNITEMTLDLSRDVNHYVEEHGPQGQGRDMGEIMDELEKANAATRRPWRKGYDASELSGENNDVEDAYTVPEEMSVYRLLHNKVKRPNMSFNYG